MNNKTLAHLSLIFFTCLSATCGHAAALQLESAEGKTVKKIIVQVESKKLGTSTNSALKSSLLTKEGAPFEQNVVDSDLKKLSEDYRNVDSSYTIDKSGEVTLTIKVQPKPIIGAIQFEGNEKIDTKKLRTTLGIKVGSVLNEKQLNEQFRKLQEFYLKKNYYEATSSYTIDTDSATGEAIIRIRIHEGKAGRIRNIFVEGVTPAERAAVRKKMNSKGYTPISFITGHGVFNQDMVAHDQLIITQYLQNEGFASASVTVSVEPIEGTKDQLNLTYLVDKGELYHVGTVEVKGNKLFTDEQIQSRIRIHSGETYSSEKVRDTTEAIQELYGRKGYIDATAPADTDLVLGKNIYNVKFEIDEGGVYKIGMIHVVGNVTTQSRVILRESLLTPGETFDSAKLKATQQRLENIGYFKVVNVYAVRTQDTKDLGDNYRDVYIEIEEKSTGSISLGAGFSSADDASLSLDLAENNFSIAGIPKIFSEGPRAMRGGGEFAHIRANFGSKQRTYSLSWMDPYFHDSYWRVGFELSESQNSLVTSEYHTDTSTFTTYASYPLSAYWTFGGKYRLRNSKLYFDRDDTPPESADRFPVLDPVTNKPIIVDGKHVFDKEKWEKAVAEYVAGRVKLKQRTGITSGVGFSLSYDSTNSAWKPSLGLRSLIDGEYIGLGGDFTFFKASYLNTLYLPFKRRGVLKLREEMRFVFPVMRDKTADDLPISEKLFLGGDSNIRGFTDYKLGPKAPETNEPTGGITSILLSAEYLYRVLPILELYTFADAGNVSGKLLEFGTFRASVGFGARIELLNNVPFVLGYGIPIAKEPGDRIEKFFFSMGAQF